MRCSYSSTILSAEVAPTIGKKSKHTQSTISSRSRGKKEQRLDSKEPGRKQSVCVLFGRRDQQRSQKSFSAQELNTTNMTSEEICFVFFLPLVPTNWGPNQTKRYATTFHTPCEQGLAQSFFARSLAERIILFQRDWSFKTLCFRTIRF